MLEVENKKYQKVFFMKSVFTASLIVILMVIAQLSFHHLLKSNISLLINYLLYSCTLLALENIYFYFRVRKYYQCKSIWFKTQQIFLFLLSTVSLLTINIFPIITEKFLQISIITLLITTSFCFTMLKISSRFNSSSKIIIPETNNRKEGLNHMRKVKDDNGFFLTALISFTAMILYFKQTIPYSLVMTWFTIHFLIIFETYAYCEYISFINNNRKKAYKYVGNFLYRLFITGAIIFSIAISLKN